MRVQISLPAAIASTLLLAGCESTSPESSSFEGPRAGASVVPSLATITGGATLQLRLMVRQPDGSSHPEDADWRSSDAGVARVERNGLVRGGAAGQARIVATWGDAQAAAVVRVLSPGGKRADEPGCLPAARAGIPDNDCRR